MNLEKGFISPPIRGIDPVTSFVHVPVAVETPQYSGLAAPLTYATAHAPPPGTLVRVPLGRRLVTGVVWPGTAESRHDAATREVVEVLDALPPLSGPWCALVAFAARYYQRGIGELALSTLPAPLRNESNAQIAKRIARVRQGALAALGPPDDANLQASAPPPLQGTTLPPPASASLPGAALPPPLTDEQRDAVAQLRRAALAGAPTVLLQGATGSGKTEVYLAAAADAIAAGRQALLLVPEINLTPQLEARVAARFPGQHVVSLHSRLTPARRLQHWLAAHLGVADLVLGTRLAVFASMPRLGLIVVDEEHDPAYKQQEGARYSARDVAVYRGRNEGIPVLLGSATPSLESWRRADDGAYLRLTMPSRIGHGALPRVRLVDMRQVRVPGRTPPVLAPALIAALQARIACGEQSIVFLNRRGYAPVLHCVECGWKSACPHCSAWRVFHKADRTLRCHHCGVGTRVPTACPDCGNADITPIGRGTERLEEQLAAVLTGAEGAPVRMARIDADSTKRAGALNAQLGAVHAGEVDVLVGTQMVAKGHDFRRVTLVAAVDPDGALFSSDFRAPERLFALLMQAAGRAGRDAAQAERSEMWVQTWHPQHPLYAALVRHDMVAFAESQLRERAMAGLPPYAHLALLRAEARTVDAARAFLTTAADIAAALPESAGVVLYPPVPTTVARVADAERLQMLVECARRGPLQRFLAAWLPQLHTVRAAASTDGQPILRWAIDVDPLTI